MKLPPMIELVEGIFKKELDHNFAFVMNVKSLEGGDHFELAPDCNIRLADEKEGEVIGWILAMGGAFHLAAR